ncbi:uncharacterized protein LOC100773017 isoform X2 [Cricetulus griseus]|uniref:Uncharacterized protein LOC100773017 isoform X2 n=1 Tax=Cricetulus griseus TaxID=10029 RepID=A0A9J7H3Y1_CRIGR|nr:uncharacterized protein LOC100773017 isoform X2 [Cricetulus griseus]
MTEPVACAACLFGGGAGPGPQQQPLTAGKGNFQDLTNLLWWCPVPPPVQRPRLYTSLVVEALGRLDSGQQGSTKRLNPRSTLSSSSAWLDHEGRGSCTSWCQLAIQGGHHSAGAGAAGDHRCSCHHCHHHPGPGCSLMTTYSPSPSFLPEWLAAH